MQKKCFFFYAKMRSNLLLKKNIDKDDIEKCFTKTLLVLNFYLAHLFKAVKHDGHVITVNVAPAMQLSKARHFSNIFL